MVKAILFAMIVVSTLACGSDGNFNAKNNLPESSTLPTAAPGGKAADATAASAPSQAASVPVVALPVPVTAAAAADASPVTAPALPDSPPITAPALPDVPASVPTTPIVPAPPVPTPPVPTPPVAQTPTPVCPQKNAKILVLDFKSGWWSGDGGDFVDRIVNGLSLDCKGTVAMEYHHFVRSASTAVQGSERSNVINTELVSPATSITTGSPFFSKAFADPTWASYTQIWLLSGSSSDSADVPITDPFFAQILNKINISKASLFIGVGFGSISHANILTQQLSLGTVFSTIQPQGNILNPMRGVSLSSSLSDTQFNSSHPIFGNGVKTIADQLIVGGTPAHGDKIAALAGFSVLATDNLKQASISVGSVLARKAVLEANLPRYYAGWSNLSDDTIQLLKNIVVYLVN
jgi:hypothetical protein